MFDIYVFDIENGTRMIAENATSIFIEGTFIMAQCAVGEVAIDVGNDQEVYCVRKNLGNR